MRRLKPSTSPLADFCGMASPEPAAPQQRTPEWYEARLGKVTASRFADVMTQPRSKAAKLAGELSETAKAYLWELVAEMLWVQHAHTEDPPIILPKRLQCLWGPPSIGESLPMQWGTFWEAEALDTYAHYFGVGVERPGFVVHPQWPLVGASPDGLVGEGQIVEVKCMGSHRHARVLATCTMPKDYIAQVQGQLWVTRRNVAHFVSFDPRLELLHRPAGKDVLLAMAVVEVPRDNEVIDRLAAAVDNFLEHYKQALALLGLDAPTQESGSCQAI